MRKSFIRKSMLALLALVVNWTTMPLYAAGQWTATGTMNTSRMRHTATLLAGGKVLVAGGYTAAIGNGYLSSAELYDPATGIWTATGSMSGIRSSHTATLLPNGKVLVVGGWNYNGAISAGAELYDPTSGTWTNASLSVARGAHTATLLANGMVLVAGGIDFDSSTPSAILYDPTTGTWSWTRAMNTARGGHAATLLANGKVLVTGGSLSKRVPGTGGVTAESLSSAELFDPATGTWTTTGAMSAASSSHTATLLANGMVLVAGNFSYEYGLQSSAELYDPVTGTWTSTGALNTGRGGYTATWLGHGKLLVAGGSESVNGATSSAELYAETTQNWAATGAMTTARHSHTATLLADGQVLVAGGSDNNGGAFSSAELYRDTVAITLGGVSHGIITRDADQYPPGTTAILTATGSPGYLFTAWTGDATGNANPLTVLMDADKAIGATFSPDSNDDDEDGLTNYQEILEFGTNPTLPDTDGDGVNDKKDAFPLDPTETLDTDHDGIGDNADPDDDGDGYSDTDELTIHHTNPKRADSDGDGLTDPQEIETHHTNPNLADTDNDGLRDGEEFTSSHTNPLIGDTDGDGFLDGYEVLTGKSPVDPLDKPALQAEARTAIEFTFPAAMGKTYRIEDSVDLTIWTIVENGIAGTGGQIQRFYSIGNTSKRYFRVEEGGQ